MEHIDDILRNSMAGNTPEARFDFKEEYWLQAQTMLEAAESKERKRRAIARWSVLALLLGLLAGWYCFWFKATEQPSLVPASTPEMADRNPATTTPTTPPTAQARPIVAPKTSEQTITPVKNIPEEATKSTATVSKSYPSNDKTIKPTSNAKLKTIITNNSPSGSIAAAPVNQPDHQPAAVKSDHAESASDRNINNAVTEGITLFYTPTTFPETFSTRAALMVPDLLPNQSLMELDNRPASSLAQYAPLIPTAPPAANIKVRPRPSPFQFGLNGAVGTYSGLFLDEKLGISLGFSTKYRFNKRFALNADLNWRRWKGNQGFSNYASQLDTYYGTGNTADPVGIEDIVYTNYSSVQYSFGYQKIETTVLPQAFHVLDLPLSIQLTVKKWILEGGLVGSARMLTKYKYEQTASQSLVDASTQTKSILQAYKANDRFQLAVFSGIYWQPSQRWNIGFRAYWRRNPSSVYETIYTSQNAVSPSATTRTTAKSFTGEIRTAFYL